VMKTEQPKLMTNWELWACALALERRHGEKVVPVIAERISELAGAGDFAGVANWKIIAGRIDQLREASWT
jgi:hypothetical protein